MTIRWLFIAIILLTATCAQAAPRALVTKQTFTTEDFTLFSGKTLSQVKTGWESYGTLNETKDNVILITHYFSGNSHAAGRYHPDDKQPGYWDAIIGPGKAIDTDKYFVISVDSLVNLSAYDPNVITTGPASMDPDTGKPYGLTFPVVTIRDFVNLQKQVLDSLGVTSLHAVIGPSMGSMQAIDWASAYPDFVERVVSVIGSAQSDAWTTAYLEHWATPIKLDKKWQQGNYSRNNPPTDGLIASLMLITQQALAPPFFNQQGKQLGYQPREAKPAQDILARHSIVNWLHARAASRAGKMDANHLLYLVRACQLFVAGHRGTLQQGLSTVTAKTLFLPASGDLLLMPYMAQKAYALMRENKQPAEYAELTGTMGHLDGVVNVQQYSAQLKTFLDN